MTPTLTAGAYLRLRRQTAGLQLAEVAARYAHHALGAPSVEILLHEAEADLARLGPASLVRLRAIYPLDPEIYLDLAEGFAAPVCRSCGCSWHDPCVGADGGCAWTDEAETLCTRCRPSTRPGRAVATASAGGSAHP